jgi:hypothetical protein
LLVVGAPRRGDRPYPKTDLRPDCHGFFICCRQVVESLSIDRK